MVCALPSFASWLADYFLCDNLGPEVQSHSDNSHMLFLHVKGGPTRPRTPLLGLLSRKLQRYFHATTCQREVLCMYNLDASAFYIALVLLQEYFTHKAKLLPYTIELRLQTWSVSFSQQSQSNDRPFFKTASLQVRFFAINDVIASVVAVKFGNAFCYSQDLNSGNPCAKFCLILINTNRSLEL